MMKDIEYKTNAALKTDKIIELYEDSGLPRPIADRPRIEQMFANSNLVVSAWAGGELVGLARSLTDFSWCCYLADLAVRKSFQKSGVGKKLVEMTHAAAGGPRSMVLLLSVPDALGYYPKIGMKPVENGFIFDREI
jgi:GNAT superfamily N-acetyltransferase